MGLLLYLNLFFDILKLVLRIPKMALRYYFRRRSARARFRRELVSSGLSEEVADELARSYPYRLTDVVKLVRGSSNEQGPE